MRRGPTALGTALAFWLSAPAPLAAGPSSTGATTPAAPTAPPSPYARRPIETACNGLDDDGDGRVDVLPPVGANACATGRSGACGAGFAACMSGARVCLAPPPMPEVRDGVDNDCDGVVDDVAPRQVRPRALLIAPRYAWTEAATDIANVSMVLAQAGVPFDRQPAGSDWTASLHDLRRYALVVVPGYLAAGAVTAEVRDALEGFAKGGGVVLVWKPLGNDERRSALELAGLKAAVRRRDTSELRFDGVRTPIVAELDSPEERTLRVNPSPAHPGGVEVYAFEPDGGTEVVAHGALTGGGAASVTGAAITRRRLGAGAIYAIGHDLATFAASECYVNCFVPSGDVLRLVLRGALREATGGHVAWTHTAPFAAPGVVVLTHDLDAVEAWKPGPWGEPGALQVAAVERAHDVRATFFAAAGAAGHFDASTARELCARGACVLAAHGVTQPRNFARLPAGTCTEAVATYGATPTACGEVRLSLALLRGISARRPRAWRSPFLAVNPRQYEVLAKHGFEFDSGFGVGDLPYNVPLDLATMGSHADRFRHQPMLEFPVACEDESDVVEAGKKTRLALDATTRARFESAWSYVLSRNVQNASFTTLHLRPWRGSSAAADSLHEKVVALDHFLVDAADAGARVMTVEDAGDFWRARLATKIDATYDARTGYAGTIAFGKTVAGLTIELGDRVDQFTCDACGPVRVMDKRVVLLTAPAAGTTAHFSATVR